MKKAILIICTLLITGTSPATELFRVEIEGKVLYRDADGSYECTFRQNRDMIIAADINDAVISRASLFPQFINDYTDDYFFSEAEREQIVLHRDSKGRLWLQEIILETRHLTWLLYNISANDDCRPPHTHTTNAIGLDENLVVPPFPLAIKQPESTAFSFELEGLEDGILRSYSNILNFQGVREDGSEFSGKILLRQQPYN